MMRRRNFSNSVQAGISRTATTLRSGEKSYDRGVALVITLLLLFLMSVLGLAAVMSSSSDLLINGYYGNYRASFYAADSGINIARQQIQTQLNNLVPATWNTTWTSCTPGTTSGPLGSGAATTAQTYLTNNYTNFYPLAGKIDTNGHAINATSTGGAYGSWGESFKIQVPASGTIVSLAPNSPSVTCPNLVPTEFTYTYNYTLISVGSATGSQQATVTENGSISIDISAAGLGSTPQSFSYYGAFINSFPSCDGPLVYGTMGGPMYANGEWNFGSGGQYNFLGKVAQTGADFSYWDGNNCVQQATVPYKNSVDKVTINPTFAAGAPTLNATPQSLPQNDFSQRWAVLDGMGCGEPAQTGNNICGNLSSPPPVAPTAQDMVNHNMQTASQQPYATGNPLTAATSGVFLPYTCSGQGSCALNTMAGGIYVEGNGPGSGVSTTITLSTANGAGGSSSPSAQVFTVAQAGNSSTTSSSTTTQTCTTNKWTGQQTCTNTTTTTTVTTTPTTYTTVTVDPVALTTMVASYTSTATSTNVCTGSCGGYGGGGTTTNSTTNSSTTTLSLGGVPHDFATGTTPAPAETMVYVNGDVNVTGPGGGGAAVSGSGPAVQNNAMVTITAAGNIQQTGNLIYATEAVTTSANQVISGSSPACCNGDAADTVIPQYANMNTVLGLFTSGGSFELNPPSNGGNLETDASIAMISSASNCTPANNCGIFSTPGNSVGTWTNIGGRAENHINGVNINTGNVYYDGRFNGTGRTNGGSLAPPWFPATTVAIPAPTNASATIITIKPQRVQWVASTGGQ